MACDSKCNGGGTWYPITKVFRVGDELIGMAGSVKEARSWLKWYQGGKKGPRPKTEDFVALSLRADGLYELCADGLELKVERGYHGIGSGGGYALAAFMGGNKDARECVLIACDIDTGSGGDVVVHTLKS